MGSWHETRRRRFDWTFLSRVSNPFLLGFSIHWARLAQECLRAGPWPNRVRRSAVAPLMSVGKTVTYIHNHNHIHLHSQSHHLHLQSQILMDGAPSPISHVSALSCIPPPPQTRLYARNAPTRVAEACKRIRGLPIGTHSLPLPLYLCLPSSRSLPAPPHSLSGSPTHCNPFTDLLSLSLCLSPLSLSHRLRIL
jgi:hypothetical protein